MQGKVGHRVTEALCTTKIKDSWPTIVQKSALTCSCPPMPASKRDVEGDEDELSSDALLDCPFSLTLDLTHRIRDYWKSKTIPDAISTPNPLFSKADLQMSKFAKDINRQPSNTGRQYGRNFRRQRDN